MGAPDRAIAPIPNADGNMTVPNHIQLLASALITTDLEGFSLDYKSLAFPCAVRAAHIPTRSPYRHKCLVSVKRLPLCLPPFIAPSTLDSGVGDIVRRQAINEPWM